MINRMRSKAPILECFSNQCLSIFTTVCYRKPENKVIHNSLIVVTERTDHDRVASMSCLQKVVDEIEQKHKNATISCSYGAMGWELNLDRDLYSNSLLQQCCMEKNLQWFYNERHHGKGPMDGIGSTVKNDVFRKVKSGQAVVYTPEEFAIAEKFVPKIRSIYLPESENIKEPNSIERSKKINETLKIHKLEPKVDSSNNMFFSFYNIADDEKPFHVQWYGEENVVVCGHETRSEDDNCCSNCNQLYINCKDWIKCPVCNGWFHERCFYE